MQRFHLAALVVLTGAVLAGTSLADPVKYALNGENTTIKFTGTKPGGKHDGGFKNVKGTLSVDGDQAAINLEIDTTSLWSDNEKLTGHLKSPDFFDVKSNPTAKFVSTKVQKTATGLTITGDLTLNGKTKSITFPATLTSTPSSATLTSRLTINKSDFGMTYGQGKINDEVALNVSIQAKK